jgi:hypothetical protein
MDRNDTGMGFAEETGMEGTELTATKVTETTDFFFFWEKQSSGEELFSAPLLLVKKEIR